MSDLQNTKYKKRITDAEKVFNVDYSILQVMAEPDAEVLTG